MKKHLLKTASKVLFILYVWLCSMNIANACNYTFVSFVSATDNGNSTYTITVQVCLAINVSWGGTTGFTLTPSGGTFTGVASLQTTTYTTSYNYCSQTCSGMTCPGSVLSGGCTGTITSSMGTITVTGCGSTPGNWFTPDDLNGVCAPNPNWVCQNITFTTNGYPSSVFFTGAETFGPDGGSGGGCPETLFLPPLIPPNPGCTTPTSTFFADDSTLCLTDNVFYFTNTGSVGPSWNYSWTFSGGANPPTSTAINPPGVVWSSPGTYTVSLTTCVTGDTCCSTTSHTVIVYPMPAVTASATNASCSGGCTGTVSATTSGGTSPYTYNWSILGPGQNKTGVCAGTYTVSVTDANGCIGTATIDVFQPNPIDLFAIPLDASCTGVCDGQLFASVTGGTGPFTYTWNNGVGVGQSQINICPGTYTVTVVDANGCIQQNNFNNTITINAGVTANAGFIYNGNQCLSGNNFVFTNTGTAGVTYSWNFGDATTSTLQNPSHTYATSGSYIVTQTVTNGPCSATYSLTVVVYSAPAATVAGTNILCAGQCNGIANLTVNGGNAPFTFLWSNNATTEDINGLCAGLYSVTVTSGNGCTAMGNVTITAPALLTTSVSGVNALCNLSCNGSATAFPSGGTGSYSYSWNDPSFQTSATAGSLCAGTYTVTVSDGNSCTAMGTITITQPAALILTPSSVSATCGMSNGSVSVSVSGGVAPFTYQWNNGCLTSSCTGLQSGTYLVAVTDSSGCMKTESAIINNAGGGVATATVNNNVNCAGACNGQATASITGGIAPYTYLWSDPLAQTGTIATGLCAGSFNVSITDSAGCLSVASVNITQPSVLNAVVTASTAASCNGICNGNATVSASGGTLPYSYLWNNTGSSTTSLTSSNLCAGITYTASVTDSNGCTDTAAVVITQPPALTASIVGTNVSCNNGNNGSANLTPSGGIGSYNFIWSNNAVSEDITNLTAGTYSVTVSDANSCTTVASVIIAQPNPLLLSTTVTNASCGLANGSSCVTATGGTLPYTYLWSDTASQTSSCATNIPAGSYTVTVKDTNNCTTIASVTVNNIPGGSAVATLINNATGFNICDGQATANLTSGTLPYTYIWNDPLAQTTATADSLCAGTFCVTITDAVGCTSSDCIIITQPSSLSSSIIGVNLLCNGVCNGSANLTVSGGNSPYIYSWTGGYTTQNISGLCAGTYFVTVTDANSVSVIDTVVIAQPPVLALSVSGTNAICSGSCNGTGSATVTGGTGSYTYLWDDPVPQTTSIASGLCVGSYNVVVTDANGCTNSNGYFVNEPPALLVSVTTITANCGQADGSITATVTNGFAPLTYTWSNGCSSSTCSGLVSNAYSVTVTDSNGCLVSGSATVANSTGPNASIIDSTQVSCPGGSDGTATVSVIEGTPPYSYSWNTFPVQTNSLATALPAGVITVTITDFNGCVTAVTVNIVQPSALVLPTTGSNPSCNGSCNGFATVFASGGTAPYSYLWNDTSSQTTNSATGLCAGSYTVTITDAKSCVATSGLSLTQPNLLVLSVTTANATCGSLCDGSATVSAFGGTPSYSYSWNTTPVQTNQTANNLCANTYVITVTDANGCTASTTALITEPSTMNASISSSSNVNCPGGCNGFAQSAISGGLAPYTYLWNTSDTVDQLINLCAGIYIVTISDNKGCSDTATVTITAPLAMTSVMTPVNVSCNGYCDGQASLSVSGGSPPYSYLWNDPMFQTTSTASNLCNGPYSVTVTDINGCNIVRNITITQPQPFSFTSSSVASTCGFSNGQACVAISGGVFPYTVLWNDPNLTVGVCITNVLAGVYNPNLTDFNGCKVTAPVIINDIAGPTIDSVSTTDLNCSGDSNGTATVYISLGTLPFTYTWKNNSGDTIGTNPTFLFGLSGGTYTITVEDGNSCIVSEIFYIIEPWQMSSAITSSANISCFGFCDGSASVMAGNGTPPYTYSWSPSGYIGQNASGLCAGINNVLAIDAKGCQVINGVNITSPFQLIISSTVTNVSCNGENDGQISVSPSGGTVPYGYIWLPAGTGSGPLVTNLSAGSYTVQVSDVNGCDTNKLFTVTQPAVLIASGTTSPSSCGNPNGQATVNPSGGTPLYTYNWEDNFGVPLTQTTQTATGLLQGSYNAIVTDANGCTFTLSLPIINNAGPVIPFVSKTDVSCYGGNDGFASITPNGGTIPYTYLWSNGQTTSSATGLTAGTYSVTLTDLNNCPDTGSVVILEPTPLLLSTSPDTTICIGGYAVISVSASGGTNGVYNYLWDDGSSTTEITVNPLLYTAYNITVTDVNGCQITDSVLVSLYPPLNVTVNNEIICNGESATLTATAGGGNSNNSYVYLWDDPNNSTSQSLTISPSALTNYTVIVSDNCSPDTFAVAVVIVNDLPVASFTWDCEPDPYEITFTSTSSAPVGATISGWNWNFGDADSSVVENPSHAYVVSQQYDVTLIVVTDQGCADSIVQSIQSPPTAEFMITQNSKVLNPAETSILSPLIDFIDASSQDVIWWFWNFGDMLDTTVQPPLFSQGDSVSHTYLQPGIYNILLMVQNQYGCLDTVVHPLLIKSEFILFAPNTFTPNADGKNDYFFPKGIGVDEETFEFYIYDRWGDLIYQSTGTFNNYIGWDGIANQGNKQAQEDVYVWLIRTDDLNGDTHEHIGHVTLIR